MRAYPPGEAAGDSGASIQLTLRRKLSDQWMVRAFVDGAYVWRWTDGFADQQLPDSFGLWGPGLGLDYGTYGQAMVSVNVGFPIGRTPISPPDLMQMASIRPFGFGWQGSCGCDGPSHAEIQ